MVQKSTLIQFAAAGTATLVYFISGTYAGWASPALARMMDGKDEPYITSDESSWIVSLSHLSQIVSCVPAGYLADTLGRKTTLLITSIPFIVSWVLIVIAESVWILYLSRIIAGLGLGLSNTVCPMYVGEIAQDRIRGALGTVFMLMLNVGQLFEDAVGPYVSRSTLGSLSAIFPVLFALTFFWMPESPYYFLIQHKKEKAELSLLRLRGLKTSKDVQAELNNMEIFVEENRKNKAGFAELIYHRGNRKAFLIMIGLLILQSLSGITAIISYTTTILEDSGISLDANVTVIIIAAIQIALAIVGSSTVDIAGRRPVLLVSTAGSAIALAAEGLFFFLKDFAKSDMSGFDWVPVSAMIVYLATFSLGVGPVPHAVMSEIFPTNVKGVAISFGTMLIAVGATVTSKLYTLLVDNFGVYVAFWVFSGCMFINVLFVTFVLPETKGKSLMQIHEELSSSRTESKELDQNGV